VLLKNTAAAAFPVLILALVPVCVIAQPSSDQASNSALAPFIVVPGPTCDQKLADALAVKGINPAYQSTLMYSNGVIPTLGFATADMASVIDPTVANFMNVYGIPGGAVAITYNNSLIFAKSYGYVDVDNGVYSEPDSRFRLASVTKPITAMGILKLVHDGKLTLTDKPFGTSGMPGVPTIISGTVPGPLALTGSTSFNPALSAITVNEILHHAGGWSRDGGPGSVDLAGYGVLQGVEQFLQTFSSTPIGAPDCTTLLSYVESQPLQVTPGTEVHYSNIGFCVLSELIREKSGVSYFDYINANVLRPLGMIDTIEGATPQSARQDRESVYYDTYSTDPTTGDPLLPSLFPPYAVGPRPYGGNIGALESLGGAGDLVSTAIDIAHFTGAIASGKLYNFATEGQSLPVPCHASGWPVLFYSDSAAIPSYEMPAGSVVNGLGWDNVSLAFTGGGSLLCYDNYNFTKEGGFQGTVTSAAATADGYGFAVLFNQNDNNVPAPEWSIFWPHCADSVGGTPPYAASTDANCALQAAYNHVAAQPSGTAPWAGVDFSAQYAQGYTGWMNAPEFAVYLKKEEGFGMYPSRLEGRMGKMPVGKKAVPTPQYRARLAPQSSKVAPNAMYGQPCDTVLTAVLAAPSNTPLINLQKFLDTATSTFLYQAVWSAPIP
jgi:CubicO group peptidase (beta-lactamase class C family)